MEMLVRPPPRVTVSKCLQETHLHWHGSWRHLSPKVHSHHALHIWLHDLNHWEALLLLLLLLWLVWMLLLMLLYGDQACTQNKQQKKRRHFAVYEQNDCLI